jgi:hypothetical protein
VTSQTSSTKTPPSVPAHRASSDTTLVKVPEHFEFRRGQYVDVPSYSAQAPNSTDPTLKPYWVGPGYVRHEDGYQTGHWSTHNADSQKISSENP